MKAKKFDLFIGYFGNGATVANKAVYENGDYKTVAHISPAGVIKLYVAPDYIPAADMEKINNVANRHKNETLTRLNRVMSDSKYNSFEAGYLSVLNELDNYTPYAKMNALIDDLRNKTDDQKKQIVIDYYLENM